MPDALRGQGKAGLRITTEFGNVKAFGDLDKSFLGGECWEQTFEIGVDSRERGGRAGEDGGTDNSSKLCFLAAP